MVFKNKPFARFCRQERIGDRELCEAVLRVEKGLIDAQLGGGVFKQRIARPNEGRSGGFRSILLFRAGSHTFFVYGFAKNERDNIRSDELEAFRLLADTLLAYTAEQLQIATDAGALIPVPCNPANEMEEDLDEQDVQE